jgi:outer membrane protein assembly factor BamB
MTGQRGRLLMLAVVASILVAAPAASAASWTQFRGGPTKEGVALDPPPDSAASWTFEAPGAGQFVASPVSDGTQVVVVEYSGVVSSLDIRDGSLLWSFGLGETVTATPAMAGGLVIVPAGDRLVAVNPGAAGRPPTPAR